MDLWDLFSFRVCLAVILFLIFVREGFCAASTRKIDGRSTTVKVDDVDEQNLITPPSASVKKAALRRLQPIKLANLTITTFNKTAVLQPRDLDDTNTTTSNARSGALAQPRTSMDDFDALPISPLGGFKSYQKSYVNMPGYQMAKEKVQGGGLQPSLIPGPGAELVGVGVGPPTPIVGGIGGPVPLQAGPVLEPGLAQYIAMMRGNRRPVPPFYGAGPRPLPPHCTCAPLADCRDVSALARDYGDDAYNGNCLPGQVVCCNQDLLDQMNTADHPVGPLTAGPAYGPRPVPQPVPVAAAVPRPVPVVPLGPAVSVPAPVVRLPPPTNYNPPIIGRPKPVAVIDAVPVPPLYGAGVGSGPVLCGKKGRNPLARVYDGDDKMSDSEFGEFPWMAAVLLAPELTYQCGGALIAPRFVLTAAHCVARNKHRNLIVRLGEYDVTNTEEPPYQDIKVTDVVMHAGYHSGTLKNDIALLVLDTPAIFNEYISPVCLPEYAPETGGVCTVTGWGKDTISHGKWANRLKSVDVPLVSNEFCEASYRKSPQLGPYFNLHDSFVCAGAPGKDACYGDGGSPMVCSRDPASERGYQLMGLVSWGIDCGQYPGAYTRVQKFVPWIHDVMNKFPN
ncbi:uncharacterized protein LOC129595062 [Paramacrobiotus metropolitanus]|uniref:uncharacterized protein LOC129595062 n=1 Tax=Paramacrobiotus metropolitanus TaxID=2943436 RepID=UPI002445C9F7|nr:uncharacterized protein LOC129595062 [Paramacrobiotus metropolitanus]